MKRILIAMVSTVLAAAVLGVPPARSQDWAKAKLASSPRHGEWVRVKHGDRTVQCFVVYPEVQHRAPAVLIVHEIFGLSDWARNLADEVAAAGYIAIAPDLLSGMGPNGGGTDSLGGRDAVVKAVSMLPEDQVIADLDSAAAYVAGLPACNGKVAVAGFCWGGGQAFQYTTHNPALKAAYVFYGTPPESDEDLARIRCPVYGFYAGNDARVSATVPSAITRMKKAGKTYEAVIYGGAGHGFMRAGEAPDATPGNRSARTAAWKRWVRLLKRL